MKIYAIIKQNSKTGFFPVFFPKAALPVGAVCHCSRLGACCFWVGAAVRFYVGARPFFPGFVVKGLLIFFEFFCGTKGLVTV